MSKGKRSNRRRRNNGKDNWRREWGRREGQMRKESKRRCDDAETRELHCKGMVLSDTEFGVSSLSVNLEQFLNITPFPSQEILFRSPWSFKTFFLSTETMSVYNHVPALPQSTVLSRFMSTRTKP